MQWDNLLTLLIVHVKQVVQLIPNHMHILEIILVLNIVLILFIVRMRHGPALQIVQVALMFIIHMISQGNAY